MLISIYTHHEGSRTRGAGQVENQGITFLRLSWLRRARALPGLLDLWGGGPGRTPESNVLLPNRELWVCCRCSLIDRGGGPEK
jgi:hypothetical protein